MKTKKVFMWSHYTPESLGRLYDAILDILNRRKKVVVTVEEME